MLMRVLVGLVSAFMLVCIFSAVRGCCNGPTAATATPQRVGPQAQQPTPPVQQPRIFTEAERQLQEADARARAGQGVSEQIHAASGLPAERARHGQQQAGRLEQQRIFEEVQRTMSAEELQKKERQFGIAQTKEQTLKASIRVLESQIRNTEIQLNNAIKASGTGRLLTTMEDTYVMNAEKEAGKIEDAKSRLSELKSELSVTMQNIIRLKAVLRSGVHTTVRYGNIVEEE